MTLAGGLVDRRVMHGTGENMTKDGRKSHTDDNWQGIKRGQVLWHKERGGPFKVMAVVDGYVVMRRPSCMPFLETVHNVGRKWLTAEPAVPNACGEPGHD